MNTLDLFLCIGGMAVVTAIPRILPITLLSGRALPPLLTRWLSFVPVSVLAALLAPELLLSDGKLHLGFDNLFLLAAIPTLLVSWYTKSFVGAVAVGMGTIALCRYVLQ
ncbi:MAG: AzlD domain-containing protein [Bilophila sp.]